MMFGQSLGLERASLLQIAQLDESTFQEPDAMMEFGVLWRLWEHYISIFPHEPLGIRYAKLLSLDHLGLVGYLIMHSPTVGIAIERFIHFQRLIDPFLTIELERQDSSVCATLQYSLSLKGMEELMEMFIGAMCHVSFSHDEQRPLPKSIHFPHAARHDLALYQEHFGVPIFFEQPQTCVIFDAQVLEWPYRDAMAPLGRTLERYMEQLMLAHQPSFDAAGFSEVEQADDLVSLVKRAIASGLHQGRFAQHDIAQTLAMSTRTLQRKLAGEGTTFATLLGQVRFSQARYLLERADSPIYEIAFVLGYQDTASFYRAFKQWSGGRTPESYRQAP